MEYLDKIKSFEDLVVWKKSMVLTKEVYLLTRTFPDDERFSLTNQIRRAVISIPSNILIKTTYISYIFREVRYTN